MMAPILDMHALHASDLQGPSPEALATVAEQMLLHIGQQSREIASQAQAIQWRDAKIERIASG